MGINGDDDINDFLLILITTGAHNGYHVYGINYLENMFIFVSVLRPLDFMYLCIFNLWLNNKVELLHLLLKLQLLIFSSIQA